MIARNSAPSVRKMPATPASIVASHRVAWIISFTRSTMKALARTRSAMRPNQISTIMATASRGAASSARSHRANSRRRECLGAFARSRVRAVTAGGGSSRSSSSLAPLEVDLALVLRDLPRVVVERLALLVRRGEFLLEADRVRGARLLAKAAVHAADDVDAREDRALVLGMMIVDGLHLARRVGAHERAGRAADAEVHVDLDAPAVVLGGVAVLLGILDRHGLAEEALDGLAEALADADDGDAGHPAASDRTRTHEHTNTRTISNTECACVFVCS